MNIDHVELEQKSRVGFLDAVTRDELVSRAQSGDSDAFARLYDHYVDEIYRYVYFLLGERKSSEDLTARVFLKAWKNLDHYEAGEESFGAWLFLIASDEVGQVRLAKKKKNDSDEIIAFSGDELASEENEPGLRLETDVLRDALQSLSWDEQSVLILKFISGMTTDDIAGHLGQSPKAVRVLQRNALHALARHFGYDK